MKKLRIILTLLGVLFGAVGLFSFRTPPSFATPKTPQHAKGQQAKFTTTKWAVSSVKSHPSSTTITFFGGDISGKQEGKDYDCVTPVAVCTVEITGSSVVTNNPDGSITVTNAIINNDGTFTE